MIHVPCYIRKSFLDLGAYEASKEDGAQWQSGYTVAVRVRSGSQGAQWQSDCAASS